MTILTVNRKELEKKVGKITPELEEKITMMGTPIEEVTENEVSVEVFPNRPDLLSLQNFAKAINLYNKKEKVKEKKFYSPEKNYQVLIDKSVKKVRPHTVCAIIKGLKFDDEKIKQVIDVQEKLHNSIGRKRKKLAIGIYPLSEISMPIRYLAREPSKIKFLPLEAKKEMTGAQILREHPTGRDYGSLLEGLDKYPIFIDAKDEILSMPPIINSEKTGRVTDATKDIFIECSGSNLFYLKKALNILVTTFYEMGGKVFQVEVVDPEIRTFNSPSPDFEKMPFKKEDIEKTLGIDLSEKQIKDYFAQMGLGLLKEKENLIALIPPERTDILHWIDLSEEIAIAYGYENFKPELPSISTIGEEDYFEKQKKVISKILSGIGLLETSSYHIANRKNIKKMHFDFNDFIELEESKTDRDVLRMDILSNHLQILFENSNSTYPQKIYEIGPVFSKDLENKESETKIKESDNLAVSLIDEKITFTDIKQILDYLFKSLNLTYSLKPARNNNYIQGRVGEIFVEEKSIGFIGEIAPRVLKNHKIKAPVAAFEIDLEFLKE